MRLTTDLVLFFRLYWPVVSGQSFEEGWQEAERRNHLGWQEENQKLELHS